MPKHRSVPNCENDSGTSGDEKKSSYKFPLRDAARLQQWLSDVGREGRTPARRQHICHEHFAPPCFKKRKATDHGEKDPKRLRSDGNESATPSGDATEAVDASAAGNPLRTVHVYEIAVDPSQQGESPGETSDVGEYDCYLQGGTDLPLTLFQTVNGLGDGGEDAELIVMSEGPGGEGQDELANGITAAVLTRGHGLVVNDSSDVQVGHEAQVICYVLPGETPAQLALPPDTVLSSALSSKPISSTLPIVSKHVQPSPASLVPTVERVDIDEGDDGQSEEDSMEQQQHQLEEHCYHKNSLSKEQLEAIVAEQQKQVKALQRRHRRHLEKLLRLESTVGQLRQSNLLNEERLQLLERACMQTRVADAAETIAIIYEEDNATYLYTPLSEPDEKP